DPSRQRRAGVGDALVEPLLGHTPAAKAGSIVAAENMYAADHAEVVEDCPGRVAQWNGVRPLILGPLARQFDPIVLDLGPAQTADFGRALAGEQKEFEDGGVIGVVEGIPYGLELGIAQDTLAGRFLPLAGVGHDVAFRQANALADYPGDE